MKILLGAVAAAASTYFLDPSRGAERRADARLRLEHGKNALARNVETASDRFEATAKTAGPEARVAAHKVARESARLGQGARNLAAGGTAALGSLLNRTLSGARAGGRGGSKVESALIPVNLVTLGLGAAAVYYFGSSRGEARRARLRARFEAWRDEARKKARSLRGGDRADDLADPTSGNGAGDYRQKQNSLREHSRQGM